MQTEFTYMYELDRLQGIRLGNWGGGDILVNLSNFRQKLKKDMYY